MVYRLLIILTLFFYLMGCGGRTVPLNTPTAHSKIVAINYLIAENNGVLVTQIIAANKLGQISTSTTETVLNWCERVAIINRQLSIELAKASPDADLVKTLVSSLAVPVTVSVIANDLDPASQQTIIMSLRLLGQLFTQIRLEIAYEPAHNLPHYQRGTDECRSPLAA